MNAAISIVIRWLKRDWQRYKGRYAATWIKRRSRCTRCWYDMTGSRDDVCPECGRPKSYSDNLWTDGRWHFKVAIGSALVWAVVALVLLLLFRLAVDKEANSITPTLPVRRLSALYGGFILVRWAGTMMTLGFAVWRTTKPKHWCVRGGLALGLMVLLLDGGLYVILGS